MATAELTKDQMAAVQEFASACTVMWKAMQGLEENELDPGTALRAIPSPDDPERSLFDELPGSLKMML